MPLHYWYNILLFSGSQLHSPLRHRYHINIFSILWSYYLYSTLLWSVNTRVWMSANLVCMGALKIDNSEVTQHVSVRYRKIRIALLYNNTWLLYLHALSKTLSVSIILEYIPECSNLLEPCTSYSGWREGYIPYVCFHSTILSSKLVFATYYGKWLNKGITKIVYY